MIEIWRRGYNRVNLSALGYRPLAPEAIQAFILGVPLFSALRLT